MVAISTTTRLELRQFLQQARARPVRTMRAFAEDDIVIPDGPHEGRRFRCSRQPYTALWFAEVDSNRWSRCVATGPTQSGKTLCAFVIPLMYHLFEISETVICGLPDMDMAGDKWREDILPIIERSVYRELIPRKGGGSRGGRVESIQFTNGATLKFMSGGGGDKSRAGFTSRVVVITETDGMDVSSTTSREADKITQLEARTRAYGSAKRIYMECTVSTETGRTWREYQAGTASRIVMPCPHCKDWVSPEREHLIGWREAATKADAREAGAFVCPACSEAWSEADRSSANVAGRVVHAGQSIDESGTITGDSPRTDTLGFRWSAVNNLFVPAGEFAADEWRASRSADEDTAEREMRQFVWCLPVQPSSWNETALDSHQLVERMRNLPRGVVPADAQWLTAAVDIGKYLLHWIVVAWEAGATGHIIDYGRIEVPSDDLGVEQGIRIALREFKDMATAGWPMASTDGDVMRPSQVWVDAGYQTPVVHAFCREAGRPFMPAIGRGAGQQHRQWYNRPKKTGGLVKRIGEGFHITLVPAERISTVEVNADHWKTWVHQRLGMPLGKPGAMSLFLASPAEHLALAKHLTAESRTAEFIAGKGVVEKWVRTRRQNHWFDALYNACAAGHLCGARLVDEAKPPQNIATVKRHPLTMPDGRPFLATER